MSDSSDKAHEQHRLANDAAEMALAQRDEARARLAAVKAQADALVAYDIDDDPAPDGIDVPDDYERGMNDAGRRILAAIKVKPW